MVKRAVLLVLASLLSAAVFAENPPPPNDNPWQTPPVPFAPLPPLLPPEAKYLGPIPITPKQSLPHPGTSFGYRWPSGSIPERCRKLYDLKTPRVLDCWLQENAPIANAISWDGSPWRVWTAKEKDELRSMFQAVRNWRASGFGPWPGPAFEEPPVNHEAPFLGEGELRTVIDSNEARRRFIAQVAVMLASEIDAWVPWSLHDYEPRILGEMFRADLDQFVPDRDDGGVSDSIYHGHIVTSGVTPAHVATLYRFFIDARIIRATPFETIARMLEWCRDHMVHYYDLFDEDLVELPAREQYEAFWHYTGFPPVVRIIEGTVVSDPRFPDTRPRSWTAGCTGTTRFLRSVLRVLNIPVREIVRPETGGHAIPYFASEGLYLSHGDDPYSQDFVTGGFTGRDLFLTTDDWMRWFPPGSLGENVGRRTVDLNLHRPSGYVVSLHCQDLWRGLSRAEGDVLRYAGHFYTLAELEAAGFYARLDALAETATDPAGYCAMWRASR